MHRSSGSNVQASGSYPASRIASSVLSTTTFALCAFLPVLANKGHEIPATEFRARRMEVMNRLPNGILLLHARSSLVNQEQLFSHGFHQDPSFYYFTGLGQAVSAILAIDGPMRKTWLFVPHKLAGMAELVKNPYVAPGLRSEERLLVDHVVSWEGFIPYLDKRLASNPRPLLFTDDSGAFMFQPVPESNPPGLDPIEDPLLLWRRALERRWPHARFNSASTVIRDMRSIKSQGEIAVLRRVGQASATSLLAGLSAIRPGRYQREVEAEVVRTCLLVGAEGPSFWPLSASGPNSIVPDYLEGLADYRHANRRMGSGELVHLDVGCHLDHYGGDVGRTVPVSGKFEPGQREVWDLLVAAYRAGLAVIRDSVTREHVYAASIDQIARLRGSLHTTLGRQAADQLLAPGGTANWYLHAAGIECCEIGADVLRAGMVVVFEPSVNVGGQGYYIEDMVLVKRDGMEVLTPGLPYTADEIERQYK